MDLTDLLSFDNMDKVANCCVCGVNGANQIFDVVACYGCGAFFEKSVIAQADPMCLNANCIMERDSIKDCEYCHLNVCLEVGMKPSDVYVRRGQSRKFVRDNRKTFRNVKDDGAMKSLKALSSLIQFERCFFDWMNLFPKFRILSEEHQLILKGKHKVRGTIMQLVERSLNMHDVLRFDNFFWDPLKYAENEETRLLSNILKFTFLIEDLYDINLYSSDADSKPLQQFHALKMKLVFKDDIDMVLDINPDELSSLMKKLDDLEDQTIGFLGSKRIIDIDETPFNLDDLPSHEFKLQLSDSF